MKLKQLAPNQTEIELNGATIFFSYATPVAACKDGQFYQTEEFHSKTTSKHINAWLEGRSAKKVPQAFLNNLAASN